MPTQKLVCKMKIFCECSQEKQYQKKVTSTGRAKFRYAFNQMMKINRVKNLAPTIKYMVTRFVSFVICGFVCLFHSGTENIEKLDQYLTEDNISEY